MKKNNIIEVSLKLTSHQNKILGAKYVFALKGTTYNIEWMENSKTVLFNDNLGYEREFNNEYDPYALILKKGESQIGYVPRDFSKIISSEFDISDKKYKVTVIIVKQPQKSA